MVEKRVSVRLAAVGGDRVKAEFEGIGNAGQRGFRKVSREAEIANARLARFARRASIAAGIMVAAAAASSIAAALDLPTSLPLMRTPPAIVPVRCIPGL